MPDAQHLLLARARAAGAHTDVDVLTAPPMRAMPWRAAFTRGLLTNALYLKVALFFLAFLPQFIAPGTEHQALAFLGLGLLFIGSDAKLALSDNPLSAAAP